MPEPMPLPRAVGAPDQASGLRRLFAGTGARVMPLVCAESLGRRPIEMALALAAQGERILILDHAWTDPSSGAGPAGGDLSDLVAGRVSVDEITCELAPGVRWMPVGKAFSVVDARGGGCDALFARLQVLAAPLDAVLLATAQPLALSSMLAAGCEFLLFATTDPSGLAGAYQLMKSLAVRGAGVRVVLDGVSAPSVAETAFRRLESTAARFLRMVPERGGFLPPAGGGHAHSSDAAPARRSTHWSHLARACHRWQSTLASIDGIGRLAAPGTRAPVSAFARGSDPEPAFIRSL